MLVHWSVLAYFEIISDSPLLEWPAQSSYRKATEFKSALESVTEEDIKSLLFNFTETEPEELVKGLESKVCQFVGFTELSS